MEFNSILYNKILYVWNTKLLPPNATFNAYCSSYSQQLECLNQALKKKPAYCKNHITEDRRAWSGENF